MTPPAVGILHPGQMGATVGASLRASGVRVGWASSGRSASTRQRAAAAGLEDWQTLERVAEQADVVVSVCPPDAAADLAAAVAASGFQGIFVDANAVSVETAGGIAATVEAAGARFVDGGIIGPPAHEPGTTRLYLSGADAEAVAAVFGAGEAGARGPLEAVVIGERPGAASALKMCYAAWTKGSAALLIAVRALAAAEDVDHWLLHEWALSQPGLEQRSEAAARKNAFKAWRFAGEMREIAGTFAAAELPGGFHEAAAEVYERLAGFKDVDPPPELAVVVEELLRPKRV
jgi:3-hydroxyisobutyrate dehydrogenase-like beta-hydroxyacid dehydrogenase